MCISLWGCVCIRASFVVVCVCVQACCVKPCIYKKVATLCFCVSRWLSAAVDVCMGAFRFSGVGYVFSQYVCVSSCDLVCTMRTRDQC